MLPKFVLEEYVSNCSKIELTTLPKIYKSWRHDKRCTAIFFDKTLVMAVYVPDSDKDLEQYEHIIFVLKILREGQRGGPKFFKISGDVYVEFDGVYTVMIWKN